MEYEQLNVSTIEAKVERKVELGRSVKMVSSYGYAGVDENTAVIIGILHYPMDGGWTVLDGCASDREEIEGNVTAFIDAELSNMDAGTPEYQRHMDDLTSEPWVAYKYKWGHAKDEIQTFPLSLFLRHSVDVF